MGPKLVYDGASEAARAVLLVAKACEVDLELCEVDCYGRATSADASVTLTDGGSELGEVRAICEFLSKSSELLPKNEEEEYQEYSELMEYNENILVPAISDLLSPILQEKECEIPASKLKTTHGIYAFLNEKLKNSEFLLGRLTIADLVLVASTSTFTTILPISCEVYPHLFSWYSRLKCLPYYKDCNEIGLNKLDAIVETRLRQI